MIDLHNHSTHSDGKRDVSNLIDYAKSKGITAMALTDHDSVFGSEEAYSYGKSKGILVLKGLELSTRMNDEPVHLIGLFKKGVIPKEMYDVALEIKESRKLRAIKMMEKIRDIFGVKIDIDELMTNEVITRGNMYQQIEKYNPQISPAEINKMVSFKSAAYVEYSRFTTEEGIKFLHDNNCVIIYAHPVLNSRKTVLDVVNAGVDGIEYRYPKNSKEDTEYFLELSNKYNLLRSAGSDYHGDDNHADIGAVSLDDNDFKLLLERLELE